MNKYVLVKVISVLIGAFSQLLLKKSAMKKYENWIREYLNVYVISAYGLFFISTFIGVYALKGMSISFSTIIESLSHILVPSLTYLFFKEKVSRRQMFGIAIVLVGIIICTL